MKRQMNMTISCLLLIISGLCVSLTACSGNKINNTPVAQFDLKKFLGTWYEIGRFDHKFERDVSACTAHYSMKSDGTIRVLNSGIKNGGTKVSEGKAKTTKIPGLMRVSFWGPFYSDYRVLMVDEDYQFALIGGSSDRYLWILSRTPELQDEHKTMVLREAVRRGYDIRDIQWVDQDFYRDEAMMR